MNFKVKIYGLLIAILMPFLLLVQMCDSNHETKAGNKVLSEVQTEEVTLK